MLISEKIGGLPLLSWVFDHGPIWAGVIVLIADFGIICALMYAEGIPPTQRTHYKTFLWNDTIFIPGIVFYWILSVFIPLLMEAFLRPQMWHLLVLVAAVGFFFNSYRDATLPFPEDAHLEGSWSKWDWHRRKY